MDHTLRRKLDRITDILWAGGVTNPVTYIEQISYLIYLKLLDEEEATRELRGRLGAGDGPSLFPLQASRYRWSKWRFKSGDALRNFVRDEVFPYMASLVKDEPQVAEYFRDAVLEIVDPNVLKHLVLNGIRRASLKRANVLSEMSGLAEDDMNRRYAVILSNPPFAGQIPTESIRRDLPSKSRKSELLFLALMLRSLAPGGRCAVVVPEGALFGSTKAHRELREHLLRQYKVQAVVSLPAGVFKPYAGVKTSVLVLRRPSNGPENGAFATTQVWFYEVRNDGYDPDKIQGGGRPETPTKNDIPALLGAWADYKASRFLEPPGAEAGALLDPGTEEPRCWWTPFEAIAKNDYNLAASRYKPRVAQPVPDEDPAELIREVLAIEREIAEGFEKLLTEVER